jgi:hypothetical protein
VLLLGAGLLWRLGVIPVPTFDGGRGEWAKHADAECLRTEGGLVARRGELLDELVDAFDLLLGFRKRASLGRGNSGGARRR